MSGEEGAAMGGCGSKEAAAAELPDHSRWMTHLDNPIRARPLMNLAIPGSHDSLTFDLRTDMPLANDQPKWLRDMDNPATRKVVKGWSTTQSLNLSQQLVAGVRYLDIRVSLPDKGTEFMSVHGLYADKVEDSLTELAKFLAANPHEVVILDLNHFYNVDLAAHKRLQTLITKILGPMLAHVTKNIASITLASLADGKKQVLCFYHSDHAELLPNSMWPGSMIPSPWADTDKTRDMIQFLRTRLAEREAGSGFWVCQGVVTPRLQDIMARPCATLRGTLGGPTTRAVVHFVDHLQPALRPKLNIIITDFVEIDNFCDVVIRLNI